ncbi:MAG TPA: PHP domain-containing protein [Spirochaetota bacterium]|nr:PHP domain-containing protein [Spirochaetota bacterium]
MDTLKQKELEAQLNAPRKHTRLQALETLGAMLKQGSIPAPVKVRNVNNHIHTSYSFSPYSPCLALWKAYQAGLETAGIMDHDSVAGAEEFLKGSNLLKMPVTVGMECRCSMQRSALADKTINNPDQPGIAYTAIHAIPRSALPRINSFFKPLREARNERNRAMTANLNKILVLPELKLDFEKDVLPLSQAHAGGSVTERHLLFALACRLVACFSRGEKLTAFLERELDINLKQKQLELLQAPDNPYYEYDLLGVLKSCLVAAFYIPAAKETPPVKEVLELCAQTGAVSAYAYLGDVTDSLTGDKKAQQFEDSYLELLFSEIKKLGFKAVTYMPSRNTTAQLKRLTRLCRAYGFMEISGEDINSPRQSFICEALKQKRFANLFDAAWALIGSEQQGAAQPGRTLFSPETEKLYPDLESRIKAFSEAGRQVFAGG